VRDVEQALYSDRHAVQLPSPPAALEFRVGRRGGAAGAIGVDRDKRREVIIDGGDPGQGIVQRRRRAQPTRKEALRQAADAQPFPPVIAAAGT
jgi:hypothetical protein